MFTKYRFYPLLTLIVISLALSACGTMHGAGKDIEHAGESVQKASD